jgi:leucyl aminopeptidase
MQRISLISDISITNYQLAIPYSSVESLAGYSQLELTEEQTALLGLDAKPGTITRVLQSFGVALLIGSKFDQSHSDFSHRDFAASVARSAKPGVRVVLALQPSDEQIPHLIEGLILGQKTPTAYKSKDSAEDTQETEFQILVTEAQLSIDIQSHQEVAKTIIAIRQIVNQPANDLYPESLAQAALDLTKNQAIEVEVWDEAKLAAERCGGILGVGKGSTRGPRLVKLQYRGGGKHLALVGKGITFDTGGLSLKPADGMVGMKYDMAGAATILGAINAIAILNLKVNVTAWMCIAENMPSGQATRPGDVLVMRNGKTVEVLNTDAEGRLVLADGLSLAQEENPDHIIDVATLTGAATIALGNRYAGVMGHGAAIDLLVESANRVDEKLWPMPLPEELRALLDSELADLTNVKIGSRAGGMLVGGHFLAEFVNPETSWAHLDIAGPANNDGSAYSVNPSGGTGVMIRTLIDFASQLSQGR